MKIFLKPVAFVTLTVMLCTAFVSCSILNKVTDLNETDSIPITFEKAYIYEDSNEKNIRSFTFYADQTGIYEEYRVYDTSTPQYNYVLSGTIEFVWRVASDGGVYLFETETNYNDDHTDGKEIHLKSVPLYFSEEFMVYTSSYQGTSGYRFILEGSQLESLVKD